MFVPVQKNIIRQKNHYFLIQFALHADKSVEPDVVGRIWPTDNYESELPLLKELLITYYRKRRPNEAKIEIFITGVKTVDKRAYYREMNKWEAFEII